MLRSYALASLLSSTLASEIAWEYAGIYAVPEDTYTWTASPGALTGTYVDPMMVVAVLPWADAESSTLSGLESTADSVMQGTCTVVEPGETLVPSLTACFELHFEDPTASVFTIDASGTAAVAIFAQHYLSEFGSDHLLDEDGHECDPSHTLAGEGDHDDHVRRASTSSLRPCVRSPPRALCPS